ncbi:MAG TPA: flagellar export protein FliJ [bacterium]|nr:flagellar export protein FliJ [bacterium]HPP87591.1 flagellar export protein FliJ [bacterium]
MKFVFKFERLLKIRYYTLEKLENQLAILQSELYRETENLKNMYRTLEETYKTLTDCLTGSIDVRHITSLKHYTEKISSDIDIQKKIIIQLNNEISAKKKQVMIAMQKVKVLEKLKEKQYAKFLKDLEYKENLTLDEIGTNQYLRKQLEK